MGNKIKEALINAGKKVLIQITDDIVKIIVGDSAGSSYSGLEKRGITDIWNAVKSAAEKVQDYLNDKMDVLKPKIMDALANAKADLNGFKEVVIDGAKKLYVKATAKGVEIIADLKGVWAKVEAALKDAQAKADEFIKAKIEEYKPQIIEALNKFQEDVEDYKDFVIEEGNKIIIRINKFGVKIVEDAQNVMDKVNEAADKLSDDVRDYVKAKVEELKPQIIEELNKGKQIIVDAAKGVVIQIRDQIVRIITGAQTGSSDEVATYGALDGRATEASSDEFEFMEKRGIADIWGKVKEAMKKLGDNIKADAKKTIEELRPKITEALENLKKIVIDAGKKIVIQINDEIVKIVVGDNTAESS